MHLSMFTPEGVVRATEGNLTYASTPSWEILTSAILKVGAVLTLKGPVTSMAEKQDQVSSKKVFYTQCLNFYQV